MLKKIYLYFGVSVFMINFVYSNNLELKKSETSSTFNRNVVKILDACFRKNLNPLITTEDIGYKFRQFFNLNRFISLITVDKNFQSQKDYRHYPKLATFALSVNSVKETENILLTLKSSIWWNIDSIFLLVGSDSCDEAWAILNSAWQKKLLSAIFLCRYDPNGTVAMYTYNPFTNRAPFPWIALNKISALNDTWTLYERRNVKDEETCKSLVYDKLKYMDGFKLRGLTIPPFTPKRDPNLDYDVSTLPEGKVVNVVKFFDTLFKTWNVTVIINYREVFGVSQNDYDLILAFMRLPWFDSAIPIYPLQQSFISISTQKRSFLTPVEKIASFYSPEAILLICVIFGTMIIALMLNNRQRISSATLEVLRLVTVSAMQQPLKTSPIRIFFFGAFWLIVVVNATFTGNLIKFLTKPERPSIESLSDIRGFKKIFIHPVLYDINKAEFSSFNQSICFFDTPDDLSVPLNHSDAALITSSQFTYHAAFKYKLHISKPFSYQYSTSGVGSRFPFTKRITEIAFRWSESGLQQFWEYQALYRIGDKLSKVEILETEFQVRPITMTDLLFAFKFFIFGLGCSFIVSIIEIIFTFGNKIIHSKIKRCRK